MDAAELITKPGSKTMITLKELFDKIDVQGIFEVVYYDEERAERVEVEKEKYLDNEINFIYVENGVLYIEIEA